MNPPASPSLSLSDVFLALRGHVGRWAVLGWLSAPLGLLLYRRLGEMMGRMERLSARFRAGRLWRMAPRSGGVPVVRSVRAKGVGLWPRQFGWLVRAASWHAAAYSGQLRLVLEQPEMVALLQAAPQAARVLTPLCRMLAVETRLLYPAVAGGEASVDIVPVPVPVVVKRVRAKRVPVDWGRIPIPRGVLAAVRRRRFLRD